MPAIGWRKASSWYVCFRYVSHHQSNNGANVRSVMLSACGALLQCRLIYRNKAVVAFIDQPGRPPCMARHGGKKRGASKGSRRHWSKQKMPRLAAATAQFARVTYGLRRIGNRVGAEKSNKRVNFAWPMALKY